MSIMTRPTPALALLFLAASTGFAQDASSDLTERYRATAGKLIQAALADTEGYDRLEYLCYRIGNRLSGSPPLERPLHMLGLGMSIGTPPGGITAEAVAVSSFDDLAKLGRDKVQGKKKR